MHSIGEASCHGRIAINFEIFMLQGYSNEAFEKVTWKYIYVCVYVLVYIIYIHTFGHSTAIVSILFEMPDM